MSFHEKVVLATNNDQLRWQKFVVEGNYLYYCNGGPAELVYIPSSSTIKLKGDDSVVHVEVRNITTEVEANVQRHLDWAVNLRDS